MRRSDLIRVRRPTLARLSVPSLPICVCASYYRPCLPFTVLPPFSACVQCISNSPAPPPLVRHDSSRRPPATSPPATASPQFGPSPIAACRSSASQLLTSAWSPRMQACRPLAKPLPAGAAGPLGWSGRCSRMHRLTLLEARAAQTEVAESLHLLAFADGTSEVGSHVVLVAVAHRRWRIWGRPGAATAASAPADRPVSSLPTPPGRRGGGC